MKGLPLSRAASGLIRALLRRAEAGHNRILLIKARSIDWQSLTFTGERHVIALRVLGPDANVIAARLVNGLGDAEFDLAGHMVADIAAAPLQANADESILVVIEALTLCA